MSFIEYVKQYCQNHDIELIESDKEKVNCYSIKCNGFFDSGMPVGMTRDYVLGNTEDYDESLPGSKMVLAYSKAGKNEEEILGLVAHEFGHANQFLDNCQFWVKTKDFDRWDKYFKSKKMKLEDVYDVWKKIVKLEADCEQRVIGFVEEFNLNIDISRYAQKANAYLYFYHFSLINKKWYKKAPYEIEEIVNKMPKKLMSLDYYADLENQEIKKNKKLFSSCF